LHAVLVALTKTRKGSEVGGDLVKALLHKHAVLGPVNSEGGGPLHTDLHVLFKVMEAS